MSHRQRLVRKNGKCVWVDVCQQGAPPERKGPYARKPRKWSSYALGCNRRQVRSFNRKLREAGISSSAYYEPGGKLVIENNDQGVRNAVMRLRGVYDLDGCYGDLTE